jgi:hypothetical protein
MRSWLVSPFLRVDSKTGEIDIFTSDGIGILCLWVVVLRWAEPSDRATAGSIWAAYWFPGVVPLINHSNALAHPDT